MRFVAPNTTGAYLSWTSYHGRSQGCIDASALAAIYIHYLKEQRPVYAPFKYGPQFAIRSTPCIKPVPALYSS